MLRITTTRSAGRSVTLRLEGRVAGRWIKELELAFVDAQAGGAAVTLDLAGVSFIESGGIEMLQGLGAVRLENPSPFILELLKGGGL